MEAAIRFAETREESEAIYRLRYDVYVVDQRQYNMEADHTRRLLLDDSDSSARHLLAEVNGKIVGALRLNWGGDAPFSKDLTEAYDLPRFLDLVTAEQIVAFSRFIVHDSYRGTSVPFQLMLAAARFALDQKVELAFCDCQPHLIGLYTRLGFRPYKPAYNHPASGILLPLMLLRDREHLKRVDSPLLTMFKGELETSEIATRVAPRLSVAPPVRVEETLSPSNYWAEIFAALTRRDEESTNVFAGLTDEEVRRLATKSQIIELGSGQTLIRRGQSTRTLFVVLSGWLNVCEEDRLVGIATKGDVVGEVAFLMSSPRMSDVRAADEGVRVLSLNEATIQALIREDSAMTAKFLLNLSRQLCRKLLERSTGPLIPLPAAAASVDLAEHG